MKPRRNKIRERGEGLVIVIILLALLGGGYWYLVSSRRNTEKEAWAFGREVAERIAIKQDTQFINQNLSPQAQVAFPPSWRERLFQNIREHGAINGPINLTGQVRFTSHFFEPRGVFRAQLNFPEMPAYLDIAVTANGGPWQIDALNLTWTPAPSNW
jgi:hypothetical protein